MRIEVLSFDGCPHHEALLPRLRDLMAQRGIDEPIEVSLVESAAAAEQRRFLGSPTLRINGVDVDPDAATRTDYGLKCRLYPTPDGLQGSIPDELISSALAAPGAD